MQYTFNANSASTSQVPGNIQASTEEAQQLLLVVFLLHSALQRHPISLQDLFPTRPFQALQPNQDQAPRTVPSLTFHLQHHHSNNSTHTI